MVKSVSVSKPVIDGEEVEMVINVLNSGMIAQVRLVREFEEKFSIYVGIDDQCPVVEEVSSKVLSLSVHPEFDEQQLKYIVDTINSVA